MRIRTIKQDNSDYTLSVPLSILPGLNADQQRYVSPISRSECMVTYIKELCERLTSGVMYFYTLLTVEARYKNKLRKRA